MELTHSALFSKSGLTPRVQTAFTYTLLAACIGTMLCSDAMAANDNMFMSAAWKTFENTVVGGFIKISAIIGLGAACFIGGSSGNYKLAGTCGGMLLGGIALYQHVDTTFAFCI